MKRLLWFLCLCPLLLTGNGKASSYDIYPIVPSLSNISIQAPGNIWVSGYEASGRASFLLGWKGATLQVPPGLPALDGYVTLAFSNTNVWVVGQGNSASTLKIYHFNGVYWKSVASPVNGNGTVSALAAVSVDDIWAVGQYNNKTLTLHWDGSTWKRIPSPNTKEFFNSLIGLTIISASDIWAVGRFGGDAKPLIEHWNGSTWTIIASPKSQLRAIAAVSQNDLWAVGTKIEHWNGHMWREFVLPQSVSLTALTVLSASDIWAVGNSTKYTQKTCAPPSTITEHWDGHAWSTVPSVTPYSLAYKVFTGELLAVCAFSSSDVWAVGQSYGQLMIEHWSGSAWKIVDLEPL